MLYARPAHNRHAQQPNNYCTFFLHSQHNLRSSLSLHSLHSTSTSPKPCTSDLWRRPATKDHRWMAAPGCLLRCQGSRHPLVLPRTLRRLKSNESQTYIAPRRQSAAVVDPGPFKPTSLVQDRMDHIDPVALTHRSGGDQMSSALTRGSPASGP